MRVGLGFDVHRFAEGDGVTLGGVKIPFEKKLVGHSDADALCHAIIDALLGAASLGDIGEHFPDTDPTYKGVSSIGLLQRVAAEVSAAGYAICNVDAVVVTERPRLIEHKKNMEKTIADAIGIDRARVSVKAKTAEGLGPIGSGDALCVQAVALIDFSET